jgi:hypothetical protein
MPLTQPAQALLEKIVDNGAQSLPLGDSRAALELQTKKLGTFKHIDRKTINVEATQMGRNLRVLQKAKNGK